MENTLIRFTHCGRSIFSFSGPGELQCPVCQQRVRFGLLDAPVALPCPFRSGHTVPCALLIACARGPAHLAEWHDTEIHVGLSDSAGLVYNYTLSGVRRDECGWERCVCVQLGSERTPERRESWDTELERFSSLPQWAPERFAEEREFGSCCYGFALTFINHMRSLEEKESLSRDQFTGSHVLPRMKTVSLYISIYQAVLQHGFHITEAPHDV
ncbi:MKRN2 opposite strand, tandem duplicate 1 [Carassius auratus]|uniref:MKRN2 opposite strand, tandem duplicate 1 n=1 Tax=Carassius auratus TaxID=7957 RepID=A0A6P6MJ78_CARAU|nr:MKRN2 opposite strand protein-like [Carassius auratus]XP_052425303.1 MKRN2 opposite strand, tandem duplicate 1 [Carassius gibelio]